jgi:hypothetical protein
MSNYMSVNLHLINMQKILFKNIKNIRFNSFNEQVQYVINDFHKN